MSMSTHVIGFKAPDSTWKKMKAVWDACQEAGLPVPNEVQKYFEWDQPDAKGIEVRIKTMDCCKEYNDSDSCRDGFEIEIAKIPKDLTHIRFYNSY